MEARIRYCVQAISVLLVLLLYFILDMFEKKARLSPPLPIKDSFMESSAVVKTLIVTSWRSGSTLLGELLNSHPGMQITVLLH